jgi:uncharacterized membrane protein
MRELQKGLLGANISEIAGSPFVDENNFLTVSSIINGLKKTTTNVLNIVLIVIASIFIIIFVVHVIKSFVSASKGKKTET